MPATGVIRRARQQGGGAEQEARASTERRGLPSLAGRPAAGESGPDELSPPGPAGSLYERALALAGIGVWECDLRTEALTWTDGVFDLFGVPRGSKLDRREIVPLYCEESREALEKLRADAIRNGRGFSLDARLVRADGEPRWMRLTAATICSQGRPTHLYGIKQDVTEERARWEEMRRMAEQDALTGLASRALFQARFLNSAASAPAVAPLGALILLDVDGFKRINDNWGHAAGDFCLETVAARLASGFRDAAMLARIGGDEFAILLPVAPPIAALERVVTHQLARLAAPAYWRGELLKVSASAGIATPENAFLYDAEALFAAADAALYEAKRTGRGHVRTAARNAGASGWEGAEPMPMLAGARR